ncbi:glycosyltransferase [Actinomycetospora chiangmaiensis]|uniref:glycosyltransferase n=1 Tax=Actinomycetospora chiangmaiensis TaxID=402650 RepID=UPI0003685666|nr:glycosyltransferase family 2 protein [Actinomycetospora chiangmaiensis]
MSDGAHFSRDAQTVDVAVVIVTFRSASAVGGLIESLRAATGELRVAVTVVDNASTDDTVAVVAAHGDVTLVAHDQNSGYAHAVNLGVAASPPCKVVAILNPDLRVAPTMLSELHTVLAESPETGVAVPILYGDDGHVSPSLRREPRVTAVLGDAVLGARWQRRPAGWGEIVYDRARYETAGSVDWATGAALAVSAPCAAAVGPWDDESFFLYSEETDFCRRARDAGWSVRVVPTAAATHSGGGSGSSPALDGLLALSRIRYARKHRGPLAAAATWLALVIGHVLRVGRPGGLARLRFVLRPWRYWTVVQHELRGARPGPIGQVAPCP